MNILKKILSPILYGLLIVPLFYGMIIWFSISERMFGLLFDMSGYIELTLYALIVGTLSFWYVSKFMVHLEKLSHPRILDHIRQSAFYYLLGSYLTISLLQTGMHGGLREGMMFATVCLSVWAILVNAAYFYLHRKKV
ncbi:MAG: hypothetical protein WCT24_02985 [Patescibacteria group bacterium]